MKLFKPIIPAPRSKEIRKLVSNFSENTAKISKSKTGRAIHGIGQFASAGLAIGLSTSSTPGLALLVGVWALAEVLADQRIHQVALRKAKHLVRKLQAQGVTDKKELLYGVKKYLKSNGSLFYCNLAIILQPTRMKKLANGENIKVGKNFAYLYDQEYRYKLLRGDDKLKTIKKLFKKNFKNLKEKFGFLKKP